MKAAEVKKLRQVKDSIGTCQAVICKMAKGSEAMKARQVGEGKLDNSRPQRARPLSVSLLLGPRVVPGMLVRLKAK